MHAYSVARKLGIGRVICPPSAGVASALGLLVAPARVDRGATVGIRLDRGSIAELEAGFARLEQEARAVMAETGLKLESATVTRLADGRFMGQGFDLVVPLPAGPYEDREPGRAALRAAFETAYREKFALTPPGVPVEFINIRVAVRAPVSGSDVVLERRPGRGARAALKGTRRAYFPGADGWVETAVYDRYRLGGERCRARQRRRHIHGPRARSDQEHTRARPCFFRRTGTVRRGSGKRETRQRHRDVDGHRRVRRNRHVVRTEQIEAGEHAAQYGTRDVSSVEETQPSHAFGRRFHPPRDGRQRGAHEKRWRKQAQCAEQPAHEEVGSAVQRDGEIQPASVRQAPQHEQAECTHGQLEHRVHAKRVLIPRHVAREEQASQAHPTHERPEKHAERDGGRPDDQAEKLEPDDLVDQCRTAAAYE